MGRLQVSGKDGKQFLVNFYRYWNCLAFFSSYICAYCVCVCFLCDGFFFLFFVNSLVVLQLEYVIYL